MAFQSVPETARVEFILSASGGIIVQNNLHFRKSGGYTPSDLATLADNMAGWYKDQIMDKLSSAISLVEVVARGLENALDYEEISTTGLPAAGSGGAAMLPINVAFAVSLRTGFVGRSARGRVYFGGFDEADATATELDADIASGLEIALNTDLPGYIPTGWVHVIVSRFHNGAKRAVGVTLPVTTAFAVDRKLDTQRRRLTRL